jgi:hypothetical protein
VIVFDADVLKSSVSPPETDPILIIDSDAVLALTITFESLEPVAGREAKVDQSRRVIESIQLSSGD